MKSLTVNVKGGLGNQLFQLSFAEYLKKNLKKKIYLNIGWYNNQNIRKFNALNYYNSEIHTTNKKIGILNKIFNYRIEKLDALLAQKKIVYKNFYDGYWQNLFFAKNLELNLFNKRLFEKKNILPKKYYIVHFRGGDFFKSKAHVVLNENYYNLGIAKLKDLPIIALGDQDHFLNIKSKININNIEFFDLDEFNSFSAIINSNGGLASNSTFCWWAIYLNLKNNKNKFFFPRTWLKNIDFSNSKVFLPNSSLI